MKVYYKNGKLITKSPFNLLDCNFLSCEMDGDFVRILNDDEKVIGRMYTFYKNERDEEFTSAELCCDYINAEIAKGLSYEYFESSDIVKINQVANDFQNYISITFTPKSLGRHMVETSFVWSHNVNNDNFRARFDLSGLPIEFLSDESREIGGTGVTGETTTGGTANTGTDVRKATSFSYPIFFNSLTEQTISLQWCSQSKDDEAAIHSGFLKISI